MQNRSKVSEKSFACRKCGKYAKDQVHFETRLY